jgi:hypothetical protein
MMLRTKPALAGDEGRAAGTVGTGGNGRQRFLTWCISRRTIHDERGQRRIVVMYHLFRELR